MRKRGLLFLVVGLMGLTGLAAEAAVPLSRTLEFRKIMMRKNAYLGEWQKVSTNVKKACRDEIISILVSRIIRGSKLPRHYSTTRELTYEEEEKMMEVIGK